MKFSVLALLSAAATLVSAQIPDLTQDPKGNPIRTPGLDEQVPAGEPYEITWDPTTPGNVAIVLLRGPSGNVVPIDTIAAATENTGSFTWTPSTELEADTTGYGLMIVVEGTGQYQYSTQFGISNDGGSPDPTKEPTKEPTGEATAEPTGDATSEATAEPTAEPTEEPEPEPTPTELPTEPSGKHTVPVTTLTSTICDCTETPTASSPSSGIVTPTNTPTPPPFDGAAGRNSVGLAGGAVAAVAAILAF